MNRQGQYRIRLASMMLAVCIVPLEPSVCQSVEDSQRDFGRATFINKGCAGCHAVYGHGIGNADPRGGPDLGKRDVYGTYLELAATMWNHFPEMFKKARKKGDSFPSFTESDVEDIISFLAFIRFVGEPGNERSGRKLLREKKCADCHSFGGRGGDIGPDFTASNDYLTPLALAAAMWNHGPQMMPLFIENGIDRPDLSGRQIVNLSVGIRSYMTVNRIPPETDRLGDPELGEALVESKRCNYCHGSGSGSGATSISFDEMHVDASVTEIAGEMWNHGPEMWETMQEKGVEFPELSAREMAAIISFLYAQRLDDSPGEATSGADLVREKGCISCHSVDGQGGGLGPSLSEISELDSPVSMISRMWNHAEEMDEEVRQRGKDWPKLSGRDLADLYAYLEDVASKEGL